MSFHKSLVAALALCVVVPVAVADSLQDRQAHETEQKRADANIAAFNERCGSSVKFVFDWASWKAGANDASGHHAADDCDVAGIKSMCNGDPTTKDAIAKQLKTVKCMGDAADVKSVKVEYNAGTLTIHTNLVNGGDVSTMSKKALKDNLK